jgi:hypothetical protein
VIWKIPAAINDQIYFIFLRRTYKAKLERTGHPGAEGANGEPVGEQGFDAALKALER